MATEVGDHSPSSAGVSSTKQTAAPPVAPPATPPAAPGRRCFVTVGATASFQKLLREVLAPAFLDTLGAHGFGELVVQTGPDHAWALQQIAALGETKDTLASRWPVIEPVSYSTDIKALMLPCRGDAATQRRPGVMISHAGSGSILDAVRCDVPLVVVANPDLLGNHQEELADAVDEAGWAIKGTLGNLAAAVQRSLDKTGDVAADTIAPYQEPPFPVPADERCGLFDYAAYYASQDPASVQGPSTLALD